MFGELCAWLGALGGLLLFNLSFSASFVERRKQYIRYKHASRRDVVNKNRVTYIFLIR